MAKAPAQGSADEEEAAAAAVASGAALARAAEARSGAEVVLGVKLKVVPAAPSNRAPAAAAATSVDLFGAIA